MSSILSAIKYISFLFLLFLFIYNPPIIGLTYYPGFYVSLLSLFALISYFLLGKDVFYSWRIIVPFSLIFLLIIYSYMIIYLHGTGDYQNVKIFIFFFIAYLLGPNLILIVLKRRDEFNLNQFFRHIVVLAVIQSIIMIVMLIIPSFKEFAFHIQKDDRTILNLESGGFRMLGIAYGVVWDLGFLQSLSLILIVWLLPRFKGNGEKIFFSVAYLLIIVSIIMSGRTGFIGFVMSILFMLFQGLYNGELKKYIWFILKISLMAVMLINIIYLSLPTDTKELVSEKIVPWAFEMFVKKSDNGTLETESSNQLKDMYFEISNTTFWIGDGYYVNPFDNARYYMDTDAGYMRQILYYGIIGSLLLYLFYLILFKKILVKAYQIHGLSGAVMFLLIGIYFFIAHIKGDILMGGDMPLRFLFLTYLLLMNIKKVKEETLEMDEQKKLAL